MMVNMAKTITLQQCPQCRSSHIFYDLGGMTGRVYRCHDCDYIGPVVIELELTEEEVKALEEERMAESEEHAKANQGTSKRKRFFRRSNP